MDNTLKHGPQILRYLSRSLGMSDKEFAQYCGYNYSQYRQNILTGKKSIEIGTYFSLQRKHSFNIDAIMKGHFEMSDTSASEIFQMPNSWKSFQHSSGKIVHVYISFFEKVFGPGKFNEFCKSQKIDPIYFYNKKNPINMEFTQRMLQEIVLKNKNDLQTLVCDLAHFSVRESNSIVSEIARELQHDYEDNKSLKIIGKLFAEIEKLEHNHTYFIEEQKPDSIVLSMAPNEHINMALWANDPVIGGFMDQFLPKILTFTGILDDYQIDVLDSAKQFGERSVFRISKS